MVSFEEIQKKCKLRKKFLDELINKQYKFKNPSPIQSIVIPLLLKYKNVVASSETGSGKADCGCGDQKTETGAAVAADGTDIGEHH